jgi:hypothetical protein
MPNYRVLPPYRRSAQGAGGLTKAFRTSLTGADQLRAIISAGKYSICTQTTVPIHFNSIIHGIKSYYSGKPVPSLLIPKYCSVQCIYYFLFHIFVKNNIFASQAAKRSSPKVSGKLFCSFFRSV